MANKKSTLILDYHKNTPTFNVKKTEKLNVLSHKYKIMEWKELEEKYNVQDKVQEKHKKSYLG